MKLLPTSGLTEDFFAKKWFFLDSDFLGLMSVDYQALVDFAELSKRGFLLIDPLTKFEFLRDVYLPKQKGIKEAFLASDGFTPAPEHQTLFTQISKNALVLSFLYAYTGCKGASAIDLFLASRATLNDYSYIITGNKKHFASAIFDLCGVLAYEENDGHLRSYSVLRFNRDKFNDAKKKWERLSTMA